jgi:hypothetical protein
MNTYWLVYAGSLAKDEEPGIWKRIRSKCVTVGPRRSWLVVLMGYEPAIRNNKDVHVPEMRHIWDGTRDVSLFNYRIKGTLPFLDRMRMRIHVHIRPGC